MIAKLKSLKTNEHADVQSARPADINYFCLAVRALIGPDQSQGEESFDFTVCTPKWLEAQLLEQPFLFPRHYLVVDHFDPQVIKKAIESLCQRTEGATWPEVAEKIARYGYWEFESYEDHRKRP